MEKYPESVDPYDPASAGLFVRVEHLARYLYAADYIRRHRLRTALDCACGDGYGCRVLAGQAEAVAGVDRNAVQAAGGIAYYAADLNQGLPMFRDAAFQCVTCFETLEHVENDAGMLEEFRRVLARGGRLLLSVPKAGYEPVDAGGKPENPHHLRLYAPDELKRMLEARGFAVEKELGQPWANAARVRAENYLRDTGKTQADIARHFAGTPESLEFFARVWAWPEAELPDKSNTMIFICRKR
jgi:SAM-dependent methyltransferase